MKPILAALGFKADSLGADDEADFLLRPDGAATDSPAVAALLQPIPGTDHWTGRMT